MADACNDTASENDKVHPPLVSNVTTRGSCAKLSPFPILPSNAFPTLSALKDRQLVLTLCLGQFLSMMITTSALSSEAIIRSYTLGSIAGIQTCFSYFLLFVVYFPYFIYTTWFSHINEKDTYEHRKRLASIFHYFPLYLLGSVLDYEANFLVVTSLSSISVLSMTLILCLTTPMVMLLSILLFKVKYKLFHYIGVSVALLGIGAVVLLPEAQSGLNTSTESSLKGHCICVAGAILYSLSNIVQEFLVKKNGTLAFLALIGLNGTVISFVQNVGLLNQWEYYHRLLTLNYPTRALLCIGCYGVSLLLFYSLTPVFLSRSNATLLNLSLISSNLYTFILTLVIFEQIVSVGYICSFIVVIFGLLLFNTT